MSRSGRFCGALAAVAIAMTVRPRSAQDTLKVAAGQRGNWDTTIAEIGQRAGIFKKHGLVPRDPVDAGRRRDAAGGDLGQRRHRRRAGHHGRAVRVLEGRAGAHHRRRDDRRVGPLLVRARRIRRSSR